MKCGREATGQSNRSGWIGFAAAPVCSNNIRRLNGYSDAVPAKFTFSSQMHEGEFEKFTVTDKKPSYGAPNGAMCFANLENGFKNLSRSDQKHFWYYVNTGFYLNPSHAD